jgi:hypothetical protein
MQLTGQTDAQLPQLVQTLGSIHLTSFFSEMASTGHSPSQAPQLTHSSLSMT